MAADPVTYRFVEEEPTSYKFVDEPGRGMKEIGREAALSAISGIFRGGGPLMGLFGEGNRQVSELADRAAYRVGGAVTDVASGAFTPEFASGLGLAANVGTQLVPTLAGGKIAEKLLSPSFRSAGRSVMQSAIKPGAKDLETGKAERAVETLLREGRSPNAAGVRAMTGEVSDLAGRVKNEIGQSSAVLDPARVVSRVDDLRPQVLRQPTPQGDLAAIEGVKNEFLSHPLLTGQQGIPIQLAQELKQGAHKKAGSAAYGLGLKPDAERDALKAIARGLREEIEKEVPNVAALNARASELMNAVNVINRRALMEGNKNPAGLALLAEGTYPALGFLADRSAGIKGILARGLYSGAERIPQTAGMIGGGALGIQSGLAPDAPPTGILSMFRAP